MRQAKLIGGLMLYNVGHRLSVPVVPFVGADLVWSKLTVVQRPWLFCGFLGSVAEGIHAGFEYNARPNVKLSLDTVFLLKTLNNQSHQLRHKVLQHPLQSIFVANSSSSNHLASRPQVIPTPKCLSLRRELGKQHAQYNSLLFQEIRPWLKPRQASSTG